MLLLRGPTATATAACWVAMMALALRTSHRHGLGVCRAFSTVQLQPALGSSSQRRRAGAASAAGIGGMANDNAAMYASSSMMSARAYASTNGYSTSAFCQTNALFAASTAATDETTDASSSTSSDVTLLGIDWVRECVAKVLNDAFDPAEVARGAALAKLEPKKKKKKKKQQDADAGDAANEEAKAEEPKMSEEEKQAILDAAAAAAQPFGELDTAVTAATKAEFGDYQCNAAMALAKNVGMAPRDCAARIVEGLRPIIGRYMEEPEIAGPGFINLRFKEEYLAQAARSMSEDAGPGGRLAVPPVA